MSETQPIVNVISLGCSKNLVDSERLMKMLESVGYTLYNDAPFDCDADITVINTCGFIGDAKQESIDTILNAVAAKQNGLTKEIVVMGCLSQRYSTELPQEITEVDRWYGKTDWKNMVSDLSNSNSTAKPHERHLTTRPHSAYLKIAEGCDRFCAFCAIPLITGRYHSTPIDDIVSEVKWLVAQGVKEFNVIAQDLTSYGKDLYGEVRIAQLIDEIASIDGVQWIRLHYAYPAQFPKELLDTMARHNNVCKYLDIALQHSSDKVLDNMHRHISQQETIDLLQEIRHRVPGIHIRTTLMVGFPGEGEESFSDLMNFVEQQRFERMGAFAYCEEEDTFAANHFDDAIAEDVKQDRLNKLMDLQEKISLEIQQQKVGCVFKVLIDEETEQFYVGRTEFDSPEVDPEVLIDKSIRLKIGEFYKVRITEALPFELIGTVDVDR